MTTTTQSAIGHGAYSVPDISLIFGKPAANVRRLVSEVCDERLGRELFGSTFSMAIGDQKFVNFHVLIELYVYMELRKLKVSVPSPLEISTIASHR